MKRFFAFALIAFLLPSVALANTPQTFSDLAALIVQFLNSGTVDLIVLAIVVYFWGVSSSLFKEGEKGHEKLREQLLWGVLVIFVAVSIWGIVQLLQNSVFGTGVGGIGGGSGNTCSSPTGCEFSNE